MLKKILIIVYLLSFFNVSSTYGQSWLNTFNNITKKVREEINNTINNSKDKFRESFEKSRELIKEKYDEYNPILREHGEKAAENVKSTYYYKYGSEIGKIVSDAYTTYGPVAAEKIKSTYDKYGPEIGRKISETYKTYGPTIANRIRITYYKYGPVIGERITNLYDEYGPKTGKAIRIQVNKSFKYIKFPEPWAVMVGISLAISDQTGTSKSVDKLNQFLKNSKIEKKFLII